MTTADNEDAPNPIFERPGMSLRESLDEQIRVKGIKPIRSVDELVCDAWESDEELDEFLADLARSRRAFLA